MRVMIFTLLWRAITIYSMRAHLAARATRAVKASGNGFVAAPHRAQYGLIDSSVQINVTCTLFS